MRLPTDEECRLLEEIHNPGITEEEFERIRKRLIEIDEEMKNGWDADI